MEMHTDKKKNGDKEAIMVFGAGGFIGAALAEHLRADGYEVIAPSSAECDLLSEASLSEYLSFLKKPVRIVFCAGITPKRDNSSEAMLKNIRMVQCLSQGITKVAAHSIVYLSSVDVYGAPEGVITEKTPISPRGYHGLAKLTSEIMFDIATSFSMPVTILRLPGIYGPGDLKKRIVGSFFNQPSIC